MTSRGRWGGLCTPRKASLDYYCTNPHAARRRRQRSPGQGLGVVEGVALVPGHAAEPQDLHPRAAVVLPLYHRESAAEAAAAVGARDPGGAPRESVDPAAACRTSADTDVAAHVAAPRAVRDDGGE
jgi:hypothetical protein